MPAWHERRVSMEGLPFAKPILPFRSPNACYRELSTLIEHRTSTGRARSSMGRLWPSATLHQSSMADLSLYNVRDHRAGTSGHPFQNHAQVRLRVHRFVIPRREFTRQVFHWSSIVIPIHTSISPINPRNAVYVRRPWRGYSSAV